MNSIKAMPFVGKVLKDFMNTSGLEPTLLGAKNLHLINARPGSVELELNIQQQHTNRLNILHGGTIASLVDLGGSLAVASMGLYATGVSTDINITYLNSGGKTGDTIKVLAECEKFGQTLAFTRVSFFNTKNELAARGSHTKFISQARKSQALLYKSPFGDDEEINQ